jgi:beta-phosphoglucomutase family hydrolase
MGTPAFVPWPSYDAVLFDLDGVLTPTAELHQKAWTTMFDEFLVPRGERPFTEDDYLAYVDGRPRFDGVRTMLASRGIVLPEGVAADPPGDGSVAALGNRKNAVFQSMLREEGIEPYLGSLRLLAHLADLGLKQAVVSSSRNAREVLDAAGLTDRFDAIADGLVAAEQHIAGKPEPDLFLAAAKWLDASPAKSVVVEDAVSGVAAGKAGDFGLVIGVDRGAGRDALMASGADLVVDDLGELVGEG